MGGHVLQRLFSPDPCGRPHPLWCFAPAEVEATYAISQRKVLGYSPDLYDAFVYIDNGLKIRMKASWIDTVEGVAESAMLSTVIGAVDS
jgi:hypothetical protein